MVYALLSVLTFRCSGVTGTRMVTVAGPMLDFVQNRTNSKNDDIKNSKKVPTHSVSNCARWCRYNQVLNNFKRIFDFLREESFEKHTARAFVEQLCRSFGRRRGRTTPLRAIIQTKIASFHPILFWVCSAIWKRASASEAHYCVLDSAIFWWGSWKTRMMQMSKFPI